MVGVPRSKACINCRARRKGVSSCDMRSLLPDQWWLLTVCQCDARMPSCGQCLKRGVHCLGYARDLKIVVLTPETQNRATIATRTSQGSSQSIDSTSPTLVE